MDPAKRKKRYAEAVRRAQALEDTIRVVRRDLERILAGDEDTWAGNALPGIDPLRENVALIDALYEASGLGKPTPPRKRRLRLMMLVSIWSEVPDLYDIGVARAMMLREDGQRLNQKLTDNLVKVWTNKSGAKDLSKWQALSDVIRNAWGDTTAPATLKKEWMQARRADRR